MFVLSVRHTVENMYSIYSVLCTYGDGHCRSIGDAVVLGFFLLHVRTSKDNNNSTPYQLKEEEEEEYDNEEIAEHSSD